MILQFNTLSLKFNFKNVFKQFCFYNKQGSDSKMDAKIVKDFIELAPLIDSGPDSGN